MRLSAVVSLANNKLLGLDNNKVNVNGGAVAWDIQLELAEHEY